MILVLISLNLKLYLLIFVWNKTKFLFREVDWMFLIVNSHVLTEMSWNQNFEYNTNTTPDNWMALNYWKLYIFWKALILSLFLFKPASMSLINPKVRASLLFKYVVGVLTVEDKVWFRPHPYKTLSPFNTVGNWGNSVSTLISLIILAAIQNGWT